MRKIKIKNFGPIKEGFVEGDGFMDLRKVTVFTGNQATGKSTAAKLISTFSWMEKALFRGIISIDEIQAPFKFKDEFCNYQGLRAYFRDSSQIEFVGEVYSFQYANGQLNAVKNGTTYLMPKIMYVPAERNFLSVLRLPRRIKDLPSPLFTFLEEFELAKDAIEGGLPLPVSGVTYEFDRFSGISYVSGEDYRIRLSEASSGLHSLVPLYLVSRHISLSLGKKRDYSKMETSLEENRRIKEEIETLLQNTTLSDELKRAALEVVNAKVKNSCFLNIVEELEQNLYPISQKAVLFELLEFANLLATNKIIITTHSPYLINYLSLAIKAHEVWGLVQKATDVEKHRNSIESVVPIASCIDPKDVAIYECSPEGTIILLPDYHGIPSDDNSLNHILGESNDLFDKLIDVQQSL